MTLDKSHTFASLRRIYDRFHLGAMTDWGWKSIAPHPKNTGKA